MAVGGAKNSVLKLMAATLLAEGTSTITNCPDILDVPLMAEVLRGLGATVELDGDVARSPHLTSRSTMPTSLRCGNSAPRSVCWDRWSGGANGPGSRCRAVTRSGRVRWICTRRAYGNWVPTATSSTAAW